MGMDFLAIDFETANFKRTSCCAIGLVMIRDGRVVDTHYQLLRPTPFYMLPDHQAVHGLSIDQVRDADRFGEAWPLWRRFFAEAPCLVAHNAPFDMSVLRNSLALYGYECPDLLYECTLAVSRKVWPQFGKNGAEEDCDNDAATPYVRGGYNLGNLAAAFDIELEHHNPLSDANACAQLMLRAAGKLGVNSVADVQQALKRPPRSLINVNVSPDTLQAIERKNAPARVPSRRRAGTRRMSAECAARMDKLREILTDCGKVAVAYSGGVDSSVLMAAAHEVLGANALAVLLRSPHLNADEAAEAVAMASRSGWHCEVVDFNEFDEPGFAANSPDRCYFCKRHLFSLIIDRAADNGFEIVADGTNADDTRDCRPGRRALREYGVRSPLLEAGLTKEQIREIARYYALPNADAPPRSCPATRFPAGTPFTVQDIERVIEGEKLLADLLPKAGQLRLRVHRDVARIELESPGALLRNEPLRLTVAERLHALGYRYIALDLEGYRTGSMNANDK